MTSKQDPSAISSPAVVRHLRIQPHGVNYEIFMAFVVCVNWTMISTRLPLQCLGKNLHQSCPRRHYKASLLILQQTFLFIFVFFSHHYAGFSNLSWATHRADSAAPPIHVTILITQYSSHTTQTIHLTPLISHITQHSSHTTHRTSLTSNLSIQDSVSRHKRNKSKTASTITQARHGSQANTSCLSQSFTYTSSSCSLASCFSILMGTLAVRQLFQPRG